MTVAETSSVVTEATITSELRDGFVQSSYKKRNSRSVVLLFDVKKGMVLPNHKHAQHQFGYTFRGEYDFVIDGNRHLATGKDSYHIQGGLYHGAVANTDYHSMDFKYIGASAELNPGVSFSVLQKTKDLDGAEMGEKYFDEATGRVRVLNLSGGIRYRLPPLPRGSKLDRVLLASNDAEVEINGDVVPLRYMKIYQLHAKGDLEIRVRDKQSEAFLYEI